MPLWLTTKARLVPSVRRHSLDRRNMLGDNHLRLHGGATHSILAVANVG